MNDTFRKNGAVGSRVSRKSIARDTVQNVCVFPPADASDVRSSRSRALRSPSPSGAAEPRRAATSGNRCPGRASFRPGPSPQTQSGAASAADAACRTGASRSPRRATRPPASLADPFRVPGHPHHPVRRWRLPRHQHPARRNARRALRIPPPKVRARSPNPIHRRRLQHRMPIQPQRIPPLLIRHHQQNIRPPLNHHPRSLPIRSTRLLQARL